ncbi:DUF3280 domain-containing protein [Streptomyces sp. NBC_00249]|uniref:hypothetical protein n=1 Tax=Streptomyces sp. NBC_00249 TaxID=2975690 RepID=UPI0022599467|nr:hypothetical protein [Streptomyces sp. NBC_00249]MCX5199700.1 DUF3280 domain-containing protein [Streptomyces sp. NBC_00249]
MDHFKLTAAVQQHRADMHARHRRIALLTRQLREAEADRDRAVERFVSLGEVHEAARHETGLRAIGRELGVTHRAVTGMVERARSRTLHPAADAPLIPVLTAEQARAYVESGALGNLARVQVAFNPADIVLESGLDPSVFPDLGDHDVPNMLLHGDDGAVVGVEECLSGYGGTGPSNTVRLLKDLGFAEDLARQVYPHRYIELAPDGVIRASAESLHGVGGGLALSPGGRHFVVRVREDMARVVADWTAEVMAEPTKYPWAAGTRRARVYLTRDAAAPLQEPYRAWRGNATFSVIIEQGRLQLWAAAYLPFQFSDILSTEQVQILDAADMRPADVEPRTWLDRFIPARRERPAFLTISEDGQDLTHIPDGDAH